MIKAYKRNSDPRSIYPNYRMQEHHIDIQPGVLFVCDMRPGFSEDGAGLTVPGGRYILTMIEIGSLQGFQLLLEGKRADKWIKFHELSLDGACVGVYDKNRFLEYFVHDFESIYEWSADRSSADQTWQDISDENTGLAFYVKTFADCNCELIKLYASNTVVGFRAIPIADNSRGEQERSWTWITFKCKGLYQEFNICHDRDYDIELDEVVEDVLSDLCTVETETGLDFLDEEGVNLDRPITSYRADFGGLSSVKVFYEGISGAENIRYSIAPEVSNLTGEIDSKSSTRELARCMYGIFNMAKKMR